MAGVTAAIVLWMVAEILPPRRSEEAPAYPPISNAVAVPPSQSPLTISAPPALSLLMGAEGTSPPRASSASPCSVEHEAAGLCKQE